MQVANFELTEEEAEAAAAAAAAAAPPPAPKMWETLLGDQFQEAQAAELAAMGRGRRVRPRVNYAEAAQEEFAAGVDVDYSGNESAHSADELPELDPEAPLAASAARGVKRGAGKDGATPQPAAKRGHARDAWQAPPQLSGALGAGNMRIFGLDQAARTAFAFAVTRFGLPLDGLFQWDWGALPFALFLLCDLFKLPHGSSEVVRQ